MKLNQLFFFDAEWVKIANTYSDLKAQFPQLYDVWEHRVKKWNIDNINKSLPTHTPSEYWDIKGGGFPEFIKMICISFGYIKDGKLKIDTINAGSETDILTAFNKLLGVVQQKGFILSGYGIKAFDMPYIAKRMMINNIKPSRLLNVYGQKPWDVNVYDLPEVWGQGSNRESYTPFEWACVANGIPTSKDDIGGEDVHKIYYTENGLERISKYCEKDIDRTYLLAKKIISLS